jgi:lipopolysaccharide transport system permease protein
MNKLAVEEKLEGGGESMASSEMPMIRIQPRRGWLAVDWRELWQYREMLYFLAWRDIKVRYKQTVLGAAWAVLQPVMSMVVFTIFFNRLAGIRVEGVAYPIFNFSGLLPWFLFSGLMSSAAGSLIGNERLVTKVYFPRLIIPSSAVGVGLADFGMAFLVLAGMMVYYKVQVGLGLLLLPVLLVLIVLTGLGVGLVFCTLNVEYRDFKYVVPFLTQLWMFVSPVVYPANLVPEPYRGLYGLNPMAGLIEAFRAAILGRPMPWDLLETSVIVGGVVFLVGIAYFRRMEYRFADLI